MGVLLVVRSKVKEVVKGFNVSGDLADVLSGKVEQLLKDAARRAEGNGRKTIRSGDL